MTFLGPKMGAFHPLPPRYILFASVAGILLFAFFLLDPRPTSFSLSSITQGVRPSVNATSAGRFENPEHEDQLRPGDIDRVANDTLGFSKIFVVGLPERSDKRDAIALASALTGFRVEWIDGVKGEQIPDKAVPFGIDREKLWNTNLGSWRGHMTAVRR